MFSGSVPADRIAMFFVLLAFDINAYVCNAALLDDGSMYLLSCLSTRVFKWEPRPLAETILEMAKYLGFAQRTQK